MPASLLSEDSPDEAPSLSANGGGLIVEESSPLERLITMSTPPPDSAELGMDATSPYFNAAGGMPNGEFGRHGQSPTMGRRGRRQIPPGTASASTVIAGTLCVLQFAFVWASFLSQSWFDTYVRTTVTWQTYFLPMLDDFTAVKIQSTTLASILSALNGADQHVVFLVLILTSLLIPCLCMILCPTWVHSDHNDRMLLQHADLGPNLDFRTPRMVFEFLARFSTLGLFALMVLDIGTSSITLSTPDTEVFLYNTTRTGLVAYALGVTCALGVFVVLRVASYQSGLRLLYVGRTTTDGRGIPPLRAFRLPWQARGSVQNVGTDEDQNEPLLGQDGSHRNNSGPSKRCCGMKDVRSFMLYQLGLVSCIAWLPALFLPMYEVSYGGLASEYMKDVSFEVAFWEFPAYIWGRAADAGSQTYMTMILGFVLVSTVYILPLVATGLAVGMWTMDADYSKVCRIVLSCIHPVLCGVVFALSVFTGSSGFEPVTDYLLAQEPSGICSQFRAVTDEPCLSIIGQPLLGAWFVLFQSVMLEVFVITSLYLQKP